MIEQCEKCALYNSLGCPYGLELAEKISDCDEFRPGIESKIKAVKEIAEKRGFTLWATINGKTLQFMDRFGVNIIVNADTGEFELKRLIPKSIFTMECPSCSPFDNDEHFSKIYRAFRRVTRTILDDIEEVSE